MKKLITLSIMALILAACGGGGSTGDDKKGDENPKPPGATKTPISIPIDKEYESYKIEDIHVKSNNDRSIIIWKEYKEEKGCSNSTDCTSSALYRADKLQGNWTLPATKQDAIKSWDNANLMALRSSDVALQSDKTAIIVTSEIAKSNTQYNSRIDMFLYKDGSWKPDNYIDAYGSFSLMPQIAMDKNGDALVVWIASSDTIIPQQIRQPKKC